MSSLVESPEYQAYLRYIESVARRRAAQAIVDEEEQLQKAMQPAIIATLAASNLPRITIGEYTLSPRREPWAYPVTGVSKQQICEALKVAGLAHLVKEAYNAQSLKSYVGQLEEHAKLILGQDPEADPETTFQSLLHPALAGLLTLKPSFTLQVRRKEAHSAQHPETQTSGDNTDDEF